MLLELVKHYNNHGYSNTVLQFLHRWTKIASGKPFPPDGTLSRWRKKLSRGQPAKAPHGGYKQPLVTELEQKQLLQLFLTFREHGLVMSWKVTRRHVHAILSMRPGGAPKRLPGKSWCKKFNFSNNFRRRVATKAARKLLDESAPSIEQRFFWQVAFLVKQHNIPKGLVFNFDETSVPLVDIGSVTLEQRGAKQVHVVGHGDKRQVTVVTGTAADGLVMPCGVIFAGKSSSRRAIPKVANMPKGFWTYQTPSHWMTVDAMLNYYKNVIVRFVVCHREELGLGKNAQALLLMDTYSTHIMPKLKSLAQADNICILFIPPGFTDRLQPQDLAINKPFKTKISSILAGHFEAELLVAVKEGRQVEWEAKLQKSKIGVPFLRAVIEAWQWLGSTEVEAVTLRRNAFHLYQKCWEDDVQNAAMAKNAEGDGLFAAQGKQRGIPVLALIEAVAAVESDEEHFDAEDEDNAHIVEDAEAVSLEEGEDAPISSEGGKDEDAPMTVVSDESGSDEDSGSESPPFEHSRRSMSGGIVNQYNSLAVAEKVRRDKQRAAKAAKAKK